MADVLQASLRQSGSLEIEMPTDSGAQIQRLHVPTL